MKADPAPAGSHCPSEPRRLYFSRRDGRGSSTRPGSGYSPTVDSRSPSLTSLSENRQLPRRSAPGIIAAEVHAMNEVSTTFLTLGAVSYGGGGILGMMQAEIQQKRGWVSKERLRAPAPPPAPAAPSGRCGC